MPGTGCDGPPGGATVITAPKPATTSDKPPSHEDYDVRLEYQAGSPQGGDTIVPRRPGLPQPGDDTVGQQAKAGSRCPVDRRPAEDQPVLADDHAPWSREDLRDRLKRLPGWHPSSPARDRSLLPADTGEDRRADRLQACPEPLTDAEHADHVWHIRAQLADARRRGLATDERFYSRPEDRWAVECQLVHREVIDELHAAAGDVPRGHNAIMAGGLGGAGKSTVLDKHAGIDRSQYLTINPDDIKEAMARHRLVPELDGLSPMEASDLAHEESSHIAKLLAARAAKDGTNIIWDITMSSASSTAQRLDDLEDARYAVRGIFVDISIEEAVRRADARHRSGHEDYRAGIGFGGRYVPPEVIEAQADPVWGSCNRRTFEQVKSRFDDWAVYDNSVTGRDPVLIEAAPGRTR
jgi:predicted ABC-type ATPase